MATPKNVVHHRKSIDRIDADILDLLSKRAREVSKIGEMKRRENGPIRVPKREFLLLDRLKRLNKGPYSDHAIESIYREIISASLSIEAPLKVAYLGPETTFSHQAALAAFGHSVALNPQPELLQVFEEVEKGSATYGVVPIENSLEGVIHQSIDLLMAHTLSICAEVVLPIRHYFLSKADSLQKIDRIYSHPQPWGQCSLWLKSHGFDYHHYEEVSSTARAAELASKNPNSAAIASSEAVRMFELTILQANIQDSANNETRFAVIGRDTPGPTGRDKTTIVLQVEDKPGVLAGILQDLAKAKINLTKIESRPSRVRNWEYLFYLDLEGHAADSRVARVLKKISTCCVTYRCLGAYPRMKGKSRE